MAKPSIWPVQGGWGGTCRINWLKDGHTHRPDDYRIHVGAAGLVAELLDAGRRDPRQIRSALDYCVEHEMMSGTDLADFQSSRVLLKDIKKLIVMLLEEWPRLLELVHKLMNDEPFCEELLPDWWLASIAHTSAQQEVA
ncbi:hypothetical protein [Paraburkholderia hospita]|uniref:hypothetical protein n=1 Tax=Paraburkholderia hospita TaxID=169430 RepID=UPI003ED0AA5E